MYFDLAASTTDYVAGGLWTPEGASLDIETPMVVWFHGNTANELQVTGGAQKTLMDAWLDLGWNVMSLRCGVTGVVDRDNDNNDLDWGSSTCRAGMYKAMQWAASTFTVHSNGFLFAGSSAGGCTSHNLLMEIKQQGSSIAVAGMSLVDPAVWLKNMIKSTTFYNVAQAGDESYKTSAGPTCGDLIVYGSPSFTVKANIKACFGLSTSIVPGSAEWVTKVDTDDGGHDPCTVDPSTAFPMVPLQIFASAGSVCGGSATDTDIMWKDNGRYLTDRMLADGWSTEMDLNVLNYGAHNSVLHYKPDLVIPFFERCLA